MRKFYFLLLTVLTLATLSSAQTISSTTYPFSSSSGNSLEDMSTGTTQLLAADLDDNASAVTNIGFDFWFVGVRQTQFSVNANGLCRLGSTAVSTAFTNDLASATNVPQIAPYWDDLWIGNNGKVHYKVIGSAPNRKLVVEWLNMQIPRVGGATSGAGTFQMWLSETTGVIEFVYGNGMAVNSTNSGYSIGFGSSSTLFASVTVNPGPTCAYGTANNINTVAITNGTKYTFTPLIPASPTGLNFTSVGSSGMTLNWTDNAINEVGYAIFRSTDGVNYSFITQTASNATSSGQAGLSPSTMYFWRVYAVTEGALSGVLSGSQSTTACAGLAGGTYSVGPTGTYPTLTAAVAAASAGITGPVIFELQNTYTSGGETFPITFPSNSCITSTNTLTIRPQTGATSLVITSSNATATIDFNGASYVTIDGRPGGTGVVSQLTISNTATGAAITTRFINDATNNTITYCSIAGSTSTTFGVVSFVGGLLTGNDNNTISNNNIGPAGANLPLNGIYSLGTSAAINNSGNIVSGNNVFDVFSATSVFTGINIGTGNSDWTIANNRVYQTAVRSVTTANTSNGILVSSGNGYAITGNTIGYATAGGTGTMILNSTVALRYIGINCTFTAGGTVNSIQGNIIASIAITSSSGAATTNGVLCGLNITSGDANIGNVTPNTFGATSGTGSLTVTSTTTQALIVGINSSSTGAILIQNNTFGAFTSSGTTAAIAGAIIGVNVSGTALSMTITGNTIGNTSVDNMRGGTSGLTTGSSIVSGVNLPSTPTTAIITNNTIQNLTSYGTGTAGYVRGIWTALSSSASATGWSISNNVINNLSTNNATAGFGSGVTSALGIHHLSSQGCLISQNSISNISNINTTATTNIIVAGIVSANASVTTSLGTVISRNRIWNLSNSTVGTTLLTPPMVVGIGIRSGNNVIDIINNMISLGAGQTTNTAFVGIWNNNGSTPNPTSTNVYHNSVNIEGAAAAGALPSFAYLRAQFISATSNTVTVDVRNNILQNSRSGGTGQHFAISNGFNSTTVSATGWSANASNYNILNANAATIGHWTSSQTFAGWQAASVSDANSISGAAVNLINTATADLHISFPPTSVVEGAGTLIATVTEDFDGQTRSTLSPTDIGADAGNFLSSPIIVVTPLANTCVTGARTLTADISDPDGVPTAGVGRPVLYWRINAGPYTPATGTFVSGNQYSFTFGAGANIGDVVSYYIAAQDNVGNVGTSPAFGSAGFTANPPAASTPPTSPYSYNLNQTLSGTYTVGAAGNYPTLTAAVNAYNNSCLGGPVVFSLIDPTYPSETFPININGNAFASAVNTLTIKPAVTTSITGSTTTGIIQLNGADYVTIDGSINNTVNSVCPASSATRDLTISNTNSATSTGVVWFGTTSGGDPVTNSAVINCIVIGNSPTTTILGIGAGGPSIGGGGTNNNNISFINNDVRACRVGIYSSGASAVNKNDGLIINQNILTAASPNNIGETGIYSAYTDNIIVSGNTIDNIIRTGSPDGVGINMGFGAISGFSATTTGIADGVSNVTITNNTIGAIENSGTFSSAGIGLGNTISGTSLIANNMIYGVKANGTAGDFAGGIVLGGGAGQVNIYNNTVSMQGTITGATAASQVSACLAVTSSTPAALDIKNNIFSNTQLGNTGATLRLVAIGLGYSSPYTGLLSDNNNLFASGAGPGTYAIGTTGGLVSGTLRTTLANWQAQTGTDASSQNVLPIFVSPTDLHLSNAPGDNWCLNGTGISIPAITNDIDCQSRSNPPDIGADEFTPTPAAAISYTGSPYCTSGGTATVTQTGTVGGTYTSTAGLSLNASTGDVTLGTSTPGTYTVTYTVTSGSCSLSATATITITAPPSATISYTGTPYCSNSGTATVTQTGTVGGTYSASPAGLSLNPANGDVTLGTSTPGTYTVTYTIAASGGCPVFTTTAPIVITAAPFATISYAGSPYCTSGGTATVTQTGTGGGTYSASPAGLTLNAGNGNVTLGTSTPGSYTVTYTIAASGGCSMYTTTASITVNPLPSVSASITEPTTCASADGSIDITVSGAAGPYTFLWTGPGVVPGNEDQTGLTVGNYSVTVTVTATGCQTTANFALAGPGGCSICPTIGSFTTTPSGAACQGSNITFTASGLTDMGSTYGIIFKRSSTPLANPYVGGTVIATVPNGGLTGGGTIATAVSSTIPVGNYYVYAILTPTPVDIACRPSAQVYLVVNPLPTINAISNQTLCNGSTTTAVNFVGTVPGTTFSWTNNTPSIGLAASGSNAPAIINPVSATTTMGSGFGTLLANTINGTGLTSFPSLISSHGATIPTNSWVSGPSVLSGSVTFDLGGTFDINGFSFWNQNGGGPGALGSTGIRDVQVLSSTDGTNFLPITGSPTTFAQVTGVNDLAPETFSFAPVTASHIRFNIANNHGDAGQTGFAEVAFARAGSIPAFVATNITNAPVVATIVITPSYTNAGTTCTGSPTTFTYTVNPTPNAVATPSSQTICSGATITTIVLSGNVSGTTYNWTRDNTGTVTGIGASGSGNISGTLTNTTTAPVTVTFTITPTANGCPGAPITATVLVNPTPNAVATPSTQTVCTGTPITTIVLSGNVSGTTYNWTRDNTVNVTGLANNGSGNISGTPVNNTTVQQTVTYTITPTANGCPGTPITATVIVNPTPTVTCPANIVRNNDPGVCGAIVNYPPATATGTPAPTVTYSIPSGSLFPLGTTTVTVTATNACGTATCSFTVTVNDTEPPVITCPANIVRNNDPGMCGAIVTFFPTVTDNCPIGSTTAVTINQSSSNAIVPGSVSCNSGGIHTDNSYWRVYDLAPLALVGPYTINRVRFGIETANGTGGTQPVNVRIYTQSGAAFPGGTRTLVRSQTFAVPNQAGTVFAANLTLPVTVPANAIVVLELNTPAGPGNSFFIGSNPAAESGPSYLSAAACAVTVPATTGSIGFPNMHIVLFAEGTVPVPGSGTTSVPASGSFFPVGTTTVVSTATDGSGNTSTCTFTVTVNDAQAPTITCPANIVRTTDPGTCTSTFAPPNPVTADNCAVTQLTWAMTGATTGTSPATGINNLGTRTFNLGVTTVTYTVRDAAGNQMVCSFTVTVNDGAIPAITTQPANRTVCAGANATFTVTATNAVSYQWQSWNGSAWVNITGATASSLTLNNVTLSMNTNSYRVIVIGLCTNTTSTHATLYVNPIPTINLTTSIAPNLLPGQVLDITATTAPSGGSYVWFKNGTVIAGASGNVLAGLTVSDAGTYRVVYTSPDGCTVTSADVVITAQQSGNLYVYPVPNNGQFTVRYYNQANEQVTIRVIDAKGALVYQRKVQTTLPYTTINVNLADGRILTSGVYVVEIRSADGRLVGTRKIIVYQ